MTQERRFASVDHLVLTPQPTQVDWPDPFASSLLVSKSPPQENNWIRPQWQQPDAVPSHFSTAAIRLSAYKKIIHQSDYIGFIAFNCVLLHIGDCLKHQTRKICTCKSRHQPIRNDIGRQQPIRNGKGRHQPIRIGKATYQPIVMNKNLRVYINLQPVHKKRSLFLKIIMLKPVRTETNLNIIN